MVIFERGAQMLAEANTIQKAKELKSLAITAGEWARRKGMGEAAIAQCRSYALEAERRMGELLAETERAKGTAGAGRPEKGSHRMLPPKPESAPTLAALGISKRESAEAQMISGIGRESFNQLLLGRTLTLWASTDVLGWQLVAGQGIAPCCGALWGPPRTLPRRPPKVRPRRACGPTGHDGLLHPVSRPPERKFSKLSVAGRPAHFQTTTTPPPPPSTIIFLCSTWNSV